MAKKRVMLATPLLRFGARWVARVIASGVAATSSTVVAAPPDDAAARDDDDDDDDNDADDHDQGDRDEDDDDDKRDIDGADGARLRLNIESEVLGGAYFNSDADGLDDSVSFGFGLARPALIDGGNTVFTRPLFSFGLGWVFADERAVLGAKMALTVDGYDLEDSDRVTGVGGRFVPYFQWIFLPERWARPYVEGRVGFGGTAMTARDRDGVNGRVTTGVIYPVVGAGVGVHLFPREWFSVDLGLNLDYAAPFGHTKASEDPPGDSDWNKIGDVLNYGVMLGASTWF